MSKHKKDFNSWNQEKKKIDLKRHKPPFVKEGEIWWVRVGENVGSEVSGKGKIFTRPVIIFKKLSSEMFLIIPLTTKEKEGSWFVSFKHKGIKETAVLSQIKVVSYKRFASRLGELDFEDFKKVKQSFKNLFY